MTQSDSLRNVARALRWCTRSCLVDECFELAKPLGDLAQRAEELASTAQQGVNISFVCRQMAKELGVLRPRFAAENSQQQAFVPRLDAAIRFLSRPNSAAAAQLMDLW